MNRRQFLRILGLAGGTAAVACQGKPPEKLIPALVPPDDGILPGEAQWVPTVCTECPAGCGLVARVREGWPVKLEGNPEHPVNRGALCARGQASLSRLYNPERIKGPLVQPKAGTSQPITWSNAFDAIGKALEEKGPHVLMTGPVGAALSAVIDEFCAARAVRRVPVFDPGYPAATARANGRVFGRSVVPSYDIDKADVLVTLGADLLETFVSPVEYARLIAQARSRGGFEWFHLEPHFSLTGSRADVRVPVRPGSEAFLLAHLLRAVTPRLPLPTAMLAAVPAVTREQALFETGMDGSMVDRLVGVLGTAPRPLLIAGGVATAGPGGETAAVIAALLQAALGMPGSTMDLLHPCRTARVASPSDLLALVDEQKSHAAGGVFMVADADPLAHLPGLKEATGRASFTVGFGDVMTPTLRACRLILPLSLPLETWGDQEFACSSDMGINAFRPAVAPLHSTMALGELLLKLTGSTESWEQRVRRSKDDSTLNKGFVFQLGKSWGAPIGKIGTEAMEPVNFTPVPKGPVVLAVPSVRTGDGRSAALPLLHELPDPLTTVTYGRWISVGPEDARRLGVEDRSLVSADIDGVPLDLPVKVQTGLVEGVFVIHRPFLAGEHLPPARFAAAEADAILPLRSIRAKGGRVRMPILSGGMTATGRGILPEPHGDRAHPGGQATLYPEHEHQDYRWGMAIDLDRCTGCSSCVAACYLENNIRLTGLDEHVKGREMSWIRLEPYFGGDGRLEFVPMLCQHCDHAPCEAVCPVLATYHNPEGLNAQVYNRCVGTRYCANNCPYKVRRFNWLDEPLAEPLPKMTNPDLSRRPKGVMEKCSFCIQRITAAKDRAKDEGRKVRDGEFTTACAQTCPAGAITFGNLLDPAAAVSRQAASLRAYRVLESIGTRPAVYYLKAVRSSEFGVGSPSHPDSKLETRNSKPEGGGHE